MDRLNNGPYGTFRPSPTKARRGPRWWLAWGIDLAKISAESISADARGSDREQIADAPPVVLWPHSAETYAPKIFESVTHTVTFGIIWRTPLSDIWRASGSGHRTAIRLGGRGP
jgi:hypothetical protein